MATNGQRKALWIFMMCIFVQVSVAETRSANRQNTDSEALFDAMRANPPKVTAETTWYLVNLNNGRACRQLPKDQTLEAVANAIPGVKIIKRHQETLPDGSTRIRFELDIRGQKGPLDFVNMHGSCLTIAEKKERLAKDREDSMASKNNKQWNHPATMQTEAGDIYYLNDTQCNYDPKKGGKNAYTPVPAFDGVGLWGCWYDQGDTVKFHWKRIARKNAVEHIDNVVLLKKK